MNKSDFATLKSDFATPKSDLATQKDDFATKMKNKRGEVWSVVAKSDFEMARSAKMHDLAIIESDLATKIPLFPVVWRQTPQLSTATAWLVAALSQKYEMDNNKCKWTFLSFIMSKSPNFPPSSFLKVKEQNLPKCLFFVKAKPL